MTSMHTPYMGSARRLVAKGWVGSRRPWVALVLLAVALMVTTLVVRAAAPQDAGGSPAATVVTDEGRRSELLRAMQAIAVPAAPTVGAPTSSLPDLSLDARRIQNLARLMSAPVQTRPVPSMPDVTAPAAPRAAAAPAEVAAARVTEPSAAPASTPPIASTTAPTTSAPAIATAPPAVPAGSTSLNARAAGLLLALNAEREQRGLTRLRPASDLNAVAEARGDDMVTNGYFAHVSPTGESWLTLINAAGIRLLGGGENLARVAGDEARSVSVAASALMDSPTHRQNILGESFTEVGMAAVTDGTGVTVFVTIFATR